MIRYCHPEDEAAAFAPIGFDDDPYWWAGVQLCAAGIALTAVTAITSVSTAQAQTHQFQDEQQETFFVPPTLTVDPDSNDIWQNWVQPLASYPLPRIQPPDDEIIVPAQNILPPDEDFFIVPWQLYDSLNWQIVLFLDDGSSLPGFQPDDDQEFWHTFVPPTQQTFAPLYLPDPEEISAGLLIGAPIFDEDFWVNPVAPVWVYPFKLFVDEDLIVPVPPLGPEEELWQNRVAPVPASNNLLAMAYIWYTAVDDFLVIVPGVGRQGINPGVWNTPSQAITPGILS